MMDLTKKSMASEFWVFDGWKATKVVPVAVAAKNIAYLCGDSIVLADPRDCFATESEAYDEMAAYSLRQANSYRQEATSMLEKATQAREREERIRAGLERSVPCFVESS